LESHPLANLTPWTREQFVRSAKLATQSERGPGRAQHSRISGKLRDDVTLISSDQIHDKLFNRTGIYKD
jgi:hypothetical protein